MIRPRHPISILAAGMLFSAAILAGCVAELGAEGTFSRTFQVDGPVQLEIASGSGDVRISQGPAGRVYVHGTIHAHGWSSESSQERLKEIEDNPPLSQENNLIRAGGVGRRANDVSIDYTIEVPPNTELHCVSGSGEVDVRGIQGPAIFTSGSGNVSAADIGNDVQALAGSGDVKFSGIQGQVQVTAGSGDIEVHSAQGAVRLHAGSGDIQVDEPNDQVVVETGSGDVTVSHAHADLRVHTGSGEITIDGNPGSSNYWDLRTSSGDVSLRVPSDASFRLYAHSSSGDIDAEIPIVMEGTTAKHELHARIGDGKARVEVATSSGKITLH
jgi:Putative adhesin